VPEPERDLTWDAMWTFAERAMLSGRNADLTVVAERRRQLFTVTEGIAAGNMWTDVFEPVRRRTVFTKTWRELQSVPDAAAKIGQFLDERPDLA
jgi:hypothetical protein